MSDGDATDLTDLAPEPAPKKRRRFRTYAIGGAVVLAAAAGVFTYQQVKPSIDALNEYGSIDYEVPSAPTLTAEPGETVYRIDPTQSSLTYEVQEQFAGRDTSTATGVTNGIAGDIAVNADDLSASRVGEIVANVFQFHSDNNLRDARIRAEFLESGRFPLARFEVDEIDGLDGELVEGEAHEFTMTGAVTVKGQTVEATFDASATLADGALTATATTEAELSRFDAGPISIAGLVTTSDAITLTLELTAYDPTERTIPTTITGPDANEPDDDAPSFADTVQPILEASCVNCHNTGEMGASHVAIDTAGDAQAISQGLKTVTELGYMPPWPASDVGVELRHEMSLSDDEIAAIGAWADAGAPLDVDADEPLRPAEAEPLPVPRQDIVMERPSYTGTVDKTNDYRCFVLEPNLDEPMFMTGETFLADQMEVLHHAQLFHISAEQRENARAKEGADGKPGWSCFAGPGLRGPRPNSVPGRTRNDDIGFSGQDNLVGGWVPGQQPRDFGGEVGFLLQPGDAFVLQMHYHYEDEALPDQSSVAIQVDPATDDIRGMRVVNPLGPVEMPCLPEDADEPLCDREAALEDNVRIYGPSGAAQQDGLLMLCNTTTEELQANFDGRYGSTSCDLKVPEDGTIVSVLGHMHTLGSSFRLTLDADTADEQVLLDIPRWSFDWQMNYELADPIHVTGGQDIRIDCSWDRLADPGRQPKYVIFADGTEDEMCFGTYALIPDDQ